MICAEKPLNVYEEGGKAKSVLESTWELTLSIAQNIANICYDKAEELGIYAISWGQAELLIKQLKMSWLGVHEKAEYAFEMALDIIKTCFDLTKDIDMEVYTLNREQVRLSIDLLRSISTDEEDASQMKEYNLVLYHLMYELDRKEANGDG